MKRVFTALLALIIFIAPVPALASGRPAPSAPEEVLECPACMETCFNANYAQVRPSVILHRPRQQGQTLHVMCSTCYDKWRLQDDRCPNCRTEIDTTFINNPRAQSWALDPYKEAKKQLNAQQEQATNRLRQEHARRQMEERARKQEQDMRRYNEEIRREDQRAENLRRDQEQSKQRQSPQLPQNNQKPAQPAGQHIGSIPIGLIICCLPFFLRWYFHKLHMIWT